MDNTQEEDIIPPHKEIANKHKEKTTVTVLLNINTMNKKQASQVQSNLIRSLKADRENDTAFEHFSLQSFFLLS